jgi:hypothetical protein
MTSVELANPGQDQELPYTQSPDLPVEQGVAMATLSPDSATELSGILGSQLGGIDVSHATAEQSSAAMRAASLTTELFKQALAADPNAFSAVSMYRGPLDMMASTVQRMHTDQTGHPFRAASFNSTNPNYSETLGLLDVIRIKAEDSRSESLHPEQVGATATDRRTIALEAVRGLTLIAKHSGRALVTPQTASQLVAFLGPKKRTLYNKRASG